MKPTLAIVGRPNVGKSTLFNFLTRSRDALVANMPGLTRDRQYGEGQMGDKRYRVIDTGGMTGESVLGVEEAMAGQSIQAVREADIVLFIVDAKAGVTPVDDAIARLLRPFNKKLFLVANKIDGVDIEIALADLYSLGMGDPIPIAAVHGRGVAQLVTSVLDTLPDDSQDEIEIEAEPGSIKIAIIGRPNVGKSTLVNRFIGEERVIVYDMPGTTRDSIYIPFERRGQKYTLIDTAGVRRRGKVKETVEKFSVVKTLAAVDDANVVVLVIDAQDGLVEQDLHLLGYVIEAGRGLVIAINKWDGLDAEVKSGIRSEIDRRLVFADFARRHMISALHGTGVGDLYESIHKAYDSAMLKVGTARLTQILEGAIAQHQPPLVRGRRIKLRYAHLGGLNPPVIVVHGNQTHQVPTAYQRFLQNLFMKMLRVEGSPIRIEFKSGENPYAGRVNKLTPRQERKRKRLMKHYKNK